MGQARWFRVFGLAAITATVSLGLSAQTGDIAAIQQKLDAQFKLTTTTANLVDIVTAGDVVELHKDGLKMSALASPFNYPQVAGDRGGVVSLDTVSNEALTFDWWSVAQQEP